MSTSADDATRLDLADMRRQYGDRGIDVGDLADDPVDQIAAWLADAVAADLAEPNAMVLSTVDASGAPASRVVLLKGLDGGHLVFFTNRTSRKGGHLTADPRCALLLAWVPLARQISVLGTARPLDDDASDAYFASRPRGSQLGAWASPQSRVVEDRRALVAARDAADARFPGRVPRPPFWGGYRVRPHEVEVWQGRPDRLHDRLRYRRTSTGWVVERLAP